jgi:hypothetical protein
MDEYYDLVTAAYELNIPKSRLYTMIKNGQIAYIQPNGKSSKIFIPKELIESEKIKMTEIIESEQDKSYQDMLSRMGKVKRINSYNIEANR